MKQEDRWQTTLHCLNDPVCACEYDPFGTELLLTMIRIAKEQDPSTKLPIIVTTKDQEAVLKLADQYARRMSRSSGGARGELKALREIVGKLVTASRKPKRDNSSDDKAWKQAYQQCEAIILVLSTTYEHDYDNWCMTCRPEQEGQVCADLVTALGVVLLHPPSDATKQLIANNRSFLAEHLQAGNFVTFLDEEDWMEEHPEARKVWNELSAFIDIYI